MIEPTIGLTLSGLEVVYLSDNLRNADNIDAEQKEFACLKPLLLNLGSAYVELVSDAGISVGPVTIEVTKAQAWLMRSKVKTGDLAIDGQTNVGVGLSRKLFAVLLEFEEAMIEPGLMDLEVSAYESPPLTEQDRLALKDEKYNRWIPDERYFQEP